MQGLTPRCRRHSQRQQQQPLARTPPSPSVLQCQQLPRVASADVAEEPSQRTLLRVSSKAVETRSRLVSSASSDEPRLHRLAVVRSGRDAKSSRATFSSGTLIVPSTLRLTSSRINFFNKHGYTAALVSLFSMAPLVDASRSWPVVDSSTVACQIVCSLCRGMVPTNDDHMDSVQYMCGY